MQIQNNAAARIQLAGSTAQIDGETVLQFADDELALDHGSLSMYTSRGMRVRVGCLIVTPANLSIETLYEVVDRNGTLTVHASRGDVYIDRHSNKQKDPQKPSESTHDLVREGQKRSREEKCAVAVDRGQAPGIGPLLNRPAVILGGAGAIGLTTYWILCESDDPVSPATPRRNYCPVP